MNTNQERGLLHNAVNGLFSKICDTIYNMLRVSMYATLPVVNIPTVCV